MSIQNAVFCENAREGWPEAIRRAMEAERKLDAIRESAFDVCRLIDCGTVDDIRRAREIVAGMLSADRKAAGM